MNIIRDIILNLAGGSMNTALLNTLIMLVVLVALTIIGVGMAYLVSLFKTEDTDTEPVVITDAQ